MIHDKLGIFSCVKTGVESVGIQTHIGSKAFQVFIAERTLVLTTLVGKEVIMKFPIGILISGALCSFGCIT
ncbi:MAG: hypothetical protein A2030_11795 [Chloroflexi bacterium RBG_19FT_COMBO_50_10]|nr:MAG: hypothetical protein A2030_11795 [Chloroflexi bacterium RBG_19FT_COMBO_50_10]